MYKHKILEDVEKNPGIESEEKTQIINSLRNAQQFFCEVDDGFESTFNRYYNKSLSLTGKRTPFEISLFCFSYEQYSKYIENCFAINTKSAVLLFQKNPDVISMLFFIYFELTGWSFYPVAIHSFNGRFILEEFKKTKMEHGFKNIEDFTLFFCKEVNMELMSVKFLLELLECKNILTVNNHPDQRINKKRTKKGKMPLFSYKTLVIKPTGKKQESIKKDLWNNRVHLCRGHFKTYTDDNPLFGKFTGRYWWQPCVRGNKKKGVIHKDYVIPETIN